MTPDPVRITLSGKEYICRLTIPQLRKINQATGKGLTVLFTEAAALNFDAICWFIWAAITGKDPMTGQPDNPTIAKDATVDQVAELLTDEDCRAVLRLMTMVVQKSIGTYQPTEADTLPKQLPLQ